MSTEDHKQGPTSVNGSAGVLELKLVVTQRHLLELDFPIGLPADRDVVDLASIRTVINAAEDGLAAVFFRGAEAERKHRRIDELLGNHLVEGRDNMVDGDGVVRETKNAIEPGVRALVRECVKPLRHLLAERKGKARLLRRLSEVLRLDGDITDPQRVLRHEALHGARAVLDGELRAI